MSPKYLLEMNHCLFSGVYFTEASTPGKLFLLKEWYFKSKTSPNELFTSSTWFNSDALSFQGIFEGLLTLNKLNALVFFSIHLELKDYFPLEE